MTTTQSGTAQQYVFLFGEGKADGSAEMRNLLGGKGAGLAEMTNLGVPVPPGFTITTEVCTAFYDRGRQYPSGLEDQVRDGVAYVERLLDRKFGDAKKPLLFSVRSGARVSMPGMMDTVLNLGLNDNVAAGLAKETGDERFAYDSYRRFVSMYGDVVMGLKGEDKDVDPFEAILEAKKHALGVELDTELPASALKELVAEYKAEIKKRRGSDFPEDPWDQLWGAVGAVFGSWENPRAVTYRRMYEIPGSWGTAVNVQAMVFGNLGNDCATGVGFTRDPSTGENRFYGEYLVNAQGEDVVAGIRTPQPVTIASKLDDQPALEETMPQAYSELKRVYESLEQHYRDMQDIEFTIQQGRLWLLQTRSGKRTARAMVKVAVDMVREGLITKEEAILRIEPDKLDELLHPTFDTSAKRDVIATGLAASPGAAVGKVAFSADDAVEMEARGEKVILVRLETSPEDIHGMKAAEGILTARGGMTSHAAVVARGMGRCCVAGCGALHIDYANGVFSVDAGGRQIEVKEGDVISLDGSTGEVMLGSVPVVEGQLDDDFAELMGWVDAARRLKVRTNADTPFDAEVARKFGAEGIGLCRTEHMFFDPERILAVREMILSDSEAGRRAALAKILPMQRSDFEGIFRAMDGLPVTIRLLDPPLHEFLPHTAEEIEEVASALGVSAAVVSQRNQDLAEFNPMLGHRGCRLAVTFPEIYETQVRAIIEAACDARADGIDAIPEIMIPIVGMEAELKRMRALAVDTAEAVLAERGTKVDYTVGTMIELPRACVIADEIAEHADFFSFGTNDLTQTTYGISRDDSAHFLPAYVNAGVIEVDPFVRLDQEGVGGLMRMGIGKGRGVKSDLKIGICGEHGGDPSSVEFCHREALDYVSCSPYRVPIARVAAAQAALRDKVKQGIS
ncbi:MAG TPA: pyruvate, phosphate dikinase, partial [Dehalococcoidia bacterium]|nr:pyruvate, phosphate dikinase [Dehalococcoidia bacterium]